MNGARLTGGTWSARRKLHDVELTLDVAKKWKPKALPPLMRLVTTVMPTFRRWPLSYRWTALVSLGTEAVMTSQWERTTEDRGDAYRRATGS